MMKLHLLGVNGPYPASHGATSGYLLEAGNRVIQFDFGSGVLSRLTALYPPEDLDALFLSHWHFDHTCDLLPLIYRLQALGKVLRVFGPGDPDSALRKIVAEASCFELVTLREGDAIDLAPARVAVGPARHPVPGVGYRVEAEGRVFGYTGDTNTLPGLAEFYQGCDLLLADALFPAAAWSGEKPHLSAVLAAQLAKEAGAKKLIMTHLNPNISPALLQKEAWAVYPDTILAEAGASYTL